MAAGERALGVDVGGTKLLAVVVGADGTVLDDTRVPTPTGEDAISEAIASLARSAGVGAVGLGIAGLIDRDGVFRVGPNLPGVGRHGFLEDLRQRTGVAVLVDNDATTALAAELRAGAAAGAREAVLVTLGTGIGGAHASGGEVQRGAHGFAGEPGHMVVDPNGPLCPCGRRGCWERYGSGSGLGRMGRDAAEAGRSPRMVELAGGDPEAVRGEHVTAAARTGDPGALAVLEEFGQWVGLGIANLVAVLDAEVVVVGGGLAEAGDVLLDPVRRHTRQLVLAARYRPEVPVVATAFGERAGAVGAALLASDLLPRG